LAFLIFLGLSLPILGFAADVTYVGTMSGIECTGCKKTISKSIAKLGGVKTIRIIKVSDSKHKLEVVTNGSKAISKSQAVAALKNAEHYKILSWSKS
ncbi:MAG: heavy-metal-associated domain-containing protein, partial [Verrucomicrobiota bacterium]